MCWVFGVFGLRSRSRDTPSRRRHPSRPRAPPQADRRAARAGFCASRRRPPPLPASASPAACVRYGGHPARCRACPTSRRPARTCGSAQPPFSRSPCSPGSPPGSSFAFVLEPMAHQWLTVVASLWSEISVPAAIPHITRHRLGHDEGVTARVHVIARDPTRNPLQIRGS